MRRTHKKSVNRMKKARFLWPKTGFFSVGLWFNRYLRRDMKNGAIFSVEMSKYDRMNKFEATPWCEIVTFLLLYTRKMKIKRSTSFFVVWCNVQFRKYIHSCIYNRLMSSASPTSVCSAWEHNIKDSRNEKWKICMCHKAEFGGGCWIKWSNARQIDNIPYFNYANYFEFSELFGFINSLFAYSHMKCVPGDYVVFVFVFSFGLCAGVILHCLLLSILKQLHATIKWVTNNFVEIVHIWGNCERKLWWQ